MSRCTRTVSYVRSSRSSRLLRASPLIVKVPAFVACRSYGREAKLRRLSSSRTAPMTGNRLSRGQEAHCRVLCTVSRNKFRHKLEVVSPGSFPTCEHGRVKPVFAGLKFRWTLLPSYPSMSDFWPYPMTCVLAGLEQLRGQHKAIIGGERTVGPCGGRPVVARGKAL